MEKIKSFKVTKNMAEKVAKAMVEPIEDEIIEINLQIGDIALPHYLSTLPKEILELPERVKAGWFNHCSQCYLNGEGLNSDTGMMRKPVLIKGHYAYSFGILVDDNEDSAKIAKLVIEKKILRDKITSLRSQIEDTLLELSTTRRVFLEFEEAKSHILNYLENSGKLKPVQVTSLALPISNIIDQLKPYKKEEDASIS